MSESGLHYFNTDDKTQLYLEQDDYVEYYDRYHGNLVIMHIIGVSQLATEGKIKYTGLVMSHNYSDPRISFRGLSCNTRKLNPEMVKLLYG